MTWLIVGLGNPGPTYSSTRHNVGYMVNDVLAGRVGGKFRAHKSGRADIVEGHLAGEKVLLCRPRSYMNESGGPVSTIANFFKVDPDHIISVYDEIDLPFNSMRVKYGGGDNGHNGVKSLRASLGTGDFYKVRVGVGRPPGRQAAADYVLKPFTPTERRDLGVIVEEAADSIESLMTVGLEATQGAFNR
ncbi:MAG: aminoacyl-tRNA hydrolase [Aeromicrobium sp.]